MKIIEGKYSQQLDVRIRFDSLEEKQAAFLPPLRFSIQEAERRKL